MRCLNVSWRGMDLRRGTLQSPRYYPCTLSCCPRERDRLSLQTCVDNVSMRTELPQENKGVGEEGDFLTSLISQKDEVYSLFFPFLSGKGNECGCIYGWQQIPHFVRYFEAFAICHPQIPVLQGSAFL